MTVIFTILALSFTLSACRTGQGSKTYTRNEAQSSMQVYRGTVVSVADVMIEADQSGTGAIVGGVAGGVAGSTVGGGDGRTLATVAGAILGSAVGAVTEKSMGTKEALEIEVDLEDGRTVVVVQEKDDEFFPGEQVRVIESGYGKYRVRH